MGIVVHFQVACVVGCLVEIVLERNKSLVADVVDNKWEVHIFLFHDFLVLYNKSICCFVGGYDDQKIFIDY